jgi:hypothetical protein
MRPETQRAIDALHAQIAALVEAEKAHHDAKHQGENWIFRQKAHTGIELAALPPQQREQMRYATASFPRVGKPQGGSNV